MTESISTSGSVSRQILADIKSAFRSYAQNSNNSVQTEEEKTYKDNGQITRKAFNDIQKAFPRTVDIDDDDTETDETSQVQQTNALQVSTQNQEKTSANNTSNIVDTENTANANTTAEVKTFSLPKNTDTIIAELKRNGLHRTMTAYQIADEYGISYMKAREILDKVNTDKNGFIREYNLPANTTVSFKV